MKAQISRDSFDAQKNYSAVYQQQGRMLTDADWNEMVRILKRRMDRTVGAAIESGSPREGGILQAANLDYDTFKADPSFRWGRVYVDGLYGEISGIPGAGTDLSIVDLIRDQRDYPSNPWNKLQPGVKYQVYADLWERLVVAFEDSKLKDTALHGADTCVRTQTMVQIKLAPENTNVKDLPARGTALIAATPVGAGPGSPQDCYSQPQGDTTWAKSNTLLRLEVHDVKRSGDRVSEVTLKWSAENGAEERRNGDKPEDVPKLTNFLAPEFVYECFSTDTEKHLGEHLVDGVNGWHPLAATLYTKDEYLAARNVPGSPALTKPRIRRWDGRVTLTRNAAGAWAPVGGPTAVCQIEGDPTGIQDLKLALKAGDYDYVVKLSLDAAAQSPHRFMTGDYWLVLLRDTGSELQTTPLSAEPVGIEHHYFAIGTLTKNAANQASYELDKPTWRRLSFPSLTNLTLDRVLVENASGQEVSVDDKFVDVDGDKMTGPLMFQDTRMMFQDAHDRVGMTLSTSASGGPRIQLDPPGSGPEAAWIKASTKQVHSGRRTTLELGVSDDGLDDILLNASGDILLDANYNVGVGTKAPHAKLDVRGPVRIDATVPDASTQQATELEIQADPQHPDQGRGFLEVPWIYTGNVQGTAGGLGGQDYARISLGSNRLDKDWKQHHWASDFNNTDHAQIGFGFGNQLYAVLDGSNLAVKETVHVPRVNSSGDLRLQANQNVDVSAVDESGFVTNGKLRAVINSVGSTLLLPTDVDLGATEEPTLEYSGLVFKDSSDGGPVASIRPLPKDKFLTDNSRLQIRHHKAVLLGPSTDSFAHGLRVMRFKAQSVFGGRGAHLQSHYVFTDHGNVESEEETDVKIEGGEVRIKCTHLEPGRHFARLKVTTQEVRVESADLYVGGEISATGGKPFVIDHPLDPENRTLRHLAVESPEGLCLYRGRVKLSEDGSRLVKMPDYFTELVDAREATVNLTAIGRHPFASSYEWNEDFSGFTAFGEPGAEVAWQVMAERRDPAFLQSKKPIEMDKDPADKGRYLAPTAYGKSEELLMESKRKTMEFESGHGPNAFVQPKFKRNIE